MNEQSFEFDFNVPYEWTWPPRKDIYIHVKGYKTNDGKPFISSMTYNPGTDMYYIKNGEQGIFGACMHLAKEYIK